MYRIVSFNINFRLFRRTTYFNYTCILARSLFKWMYTWRLFALLYNHRWSNICRWRETCIDFQFCFCFCFLRIQSIFLYYGCCVCGEKITNIHYHLLKLEKLIVPRIFPLLNLYFFLHVATICVDSLWAFEFDYLYCDYFVRYLVATVMQLYNLNAPNI